MSGGHFDYKQWFIDDIADEVYGLIARNNSSEMDELFDDNTIDKFKEAALTLRRASRMAHRIDWLVSGDDGQESFHKRWEEELGETSVENSF